MTSQHLTSLAFDSAPGPAWVHLLVMAFALFVLVRSLNRHH
ncbi:hypothetical protein [Streptomyces sp. ISL-66]|nr:hypothetical protein [Streptomyces sp. ISL-66]